MARIVREEGVLSLYRGLGPSLLLVSHGSLQARRPARSTHRLRLLHAQAQAAAAVRLRLLHAQA